MKLLSPVDQMFIRMESTRTPMHIGALAIFQLPEGSGRDFVRALHDGFAQLDFLPFPFDSVIAGPDNLRYWKQVTPDPAYHVRLSALPFPGTERDLGTLIERLHSYPLDMTKPLWEAHVIEGLEGNRFAFYFKAHHGAVDGMGAMNLIKRWLTTDPTAAPGSGVSEADDDFSLTNTFAVTLARRVADGVTAVGEIAAKLAAMAIGSNSHIVAALKTPSTPFNARLTQHRRVATAQVDLPRLKAVAAATEATVNDVILASLGGATRQYLTERDALPRRSLTASVPIGWERDEDTLNAATGFVTPLATNEPDPLARVAKISRATVRGKAELLEMSENALQHYTLAGLLPLYIGQKSVPLPPLFNFTVSNVVLSRERLYLAGAALEYLVPVSFLCDGYGLNVTLVGYTDKVVLGFVGCRDTVPSLQRLAQYTERAFSELEQAAL